MEGQKKRPNQNELFALRGLHERELKLPQRGQTYDTTTLQTVSDDYAPQGSYSKGIILS